MYIHRYVPMYLCTYVLMYLRTYIPTYLHTVSNSSRDFFQAGEIPPKPWGTETFWSAFHRRAPPALNNLAKFSMDPAHLADVIPEDLEESMYQLLPFEDEVRARVYCNRLRKIVEELSTNLQPL
jgi:hypothetical protein